MKLSARSRYGLRAMLELALNYNNGHILVREISNKQNISRRYLEHLIVSLQGAGLVKTIRGKKGGCALAKKPSEIKVADIVKVLDGTIIPVDCISEEDSCDKRKICVARNVWVKVKDAVDKVLNSITLSDMVKWHKKKIKNSDTTVYYI
jgi:Rrf2 family protein